MIRNIKNTIVLAAIFMLTSVGSIFAANEKVFVNKEVTTHIVMPEVIKLVDISTEYIIGNQCADNMIRIKPNNSTDSCFTDGKLIGTLTIIGERHLAQYDVIYTTAPTCATSILRVGYNTLQKYINPEVSMPFSEMSRYAWAVYGSKPKKHISTKKHGVHAVINNIYSVGDYFFIDYSLKNDTKIDYDIAEVRVSLQDKKDVKATNSQTIDLTPVLSINNDKSFRKFYRNVIVLEKLTFPEEKVLDITVSENQISGRTITMRIKYKDILKADGFSSDILKY